MKGHNMHGTRFYEIYNNLKRRCNDPKSERYPHYGARGIKCLWPSFIDFKRDMLPSYLEHCKTYGEKNTSIERIDNNGNYCKENCTWATWDKQMVNQSKTIRIEYNGKKQALSLWARELDMNYKCLHKRIRVFGWSIERAFETPSKTGYDGLH